MAALLLTVSVWAAFALSARALAASTLLPADAALLRFGVPLVVLAPALWRRRRALAAVRPGPAAKIVCGAGVPFFLAAMFGGSLTSASFVGAIVPGMVPLFVSALMVARGRGLPRGTQSAGLLLIAAGVVALVWRYAVPFDADVMLGSGTLLVASGLWALYTVGLREVDLDPVGSIGLLCLPSFAVIGVLVAAGVLPTGAGAGGGRRHRAVPGGAGAGRGTVRRPAVRVRDPPAGRRARLRRRQPQPRGRGGAGDPPAG